MGEREAGYVSQHRPSDGRAPRQRLAWRGERRRRKPQALRPHARRHLELRRLHVRQGRPPCSPDFLRGLLHWAWDAQRQVHRHARPAIGHAPHRGRVRQGTREDRNLRGVHGGPACPDRRFRRRRQLGRPPDGAQRAETLPDRSEVVEGIVLRAPLHDQPALARRSARLDDERHRRFERARRGA